MEIIVLDFDVSNTKGHILCTGEIVGGGGGIVKWEGSADCKKYYDSVRTAVLFNFSLSLEPPRNDYDW
jgi:hypothetical protein